MLSFPDGRVICESGAILLHLCETFDTAHTLHPAVGDPSRPRFLQGVIYGVTECYKAATAVFMETFMKEEKCQDKEKITAVKKRFREVVIDHIVRELDHGKRMFYLGDTFSAADIVIGYALMTADFTKCDLLENVVVSAYYERLKERGALLQSCYIILHLHSCTKDYQLEGQW